VEPLEWEGFTWTESGEPAAVDINGDSSPPGQTEGADGSEAAAQGSEAVLAGPPVTAVDGSISLESCLAAFFAPEAITWACPAELKVSNDMKPSAHVEIAVFLARSDSLDARLRCKPMVEFGMYATARLVTIPQHLLSITSCDEDTRCTL